VQCDSRFLAAVDRRTGYHTHSILCVPVRDTDSQIIGVMQCVNKVDGEFEPDDEECLVLISHLFSLVLLRHAFGATNKKKGGSSGSSNASGLVLPSLLNAPASAASGAQSPSAAGGGAGGAWAQPSQLLSSTSSSSLNSVSSAAPPPLHKTASMASVASTGRSGSSSGLSTPHSASSSSTSNLYSSLSPSMSTTKLNALAREESKQSAASAAASASAAGDRRGGGGLSSTTNWVLFDIQGKSYPGSRRLHPNVPPVCVVLCDLPVCAWRVHLSFHFFFPVVPFSLMSASASDLSVFL
jgi:hypothetical protein